MNENEKIKDSELVQASGGNRQETYELGQYLYSKFPEEFDNPEKITLDQVYDCLRKKKSRISIPCVNRVMHAPTPIHPLTTRMKKSAMRNS